MRTLSSSPPKNSPVLPDRPELRCSPDALVYVRFFPPGKPWPSLEVPMAPREVAVALERSAPLRLPPHPDGRTHNWRRWALEQKRPLAVDLFAGCGGLSLGLEEAGYAVAMSVDHDEWAVESHRHNLPGVALNRDLSDPTNIATVAELLNGLPIKLVAAGPPCQPFSRAGRSKLRSLVEDGIRAERDDRAELWQAFLEVVEQVRPDAVLMENVPDLGLADEFALLRLIAARLERVGYEVDFRLLEAWRFGVPQYRQRLILVGRRDGRPFEWPEGPRSVGPRAPRRCRPSPRERSSSGVQGST